MNEEGENKSWFDDFDKAFEFDSVDDAGESNEEMKEAALGRIDPEGKSINPNNPLLWTEKNRALFVFDWAADMVKAHDEMKVSDFNVGLTIDNCRMEASMVGSDMFLTVYKTDEYGGRIINGWSVPTFLLMSIDLDRAMWD